MPIEQSDTQKLLAEWQEAKDLRQRIWDTLFQQCKDVVWPNSEDFTVTRQPGTYLVELCYDSTAPQANEQFANGMHAAVANPFEQWFQISIEDEKLAKDRDVKYWLEQVTNIITNCYAYPQANHKQSMHEYFLGLGCLGTSAVSQEWNEKIDGPCFSSPNLSNVWVAEDDFGLVNKVFRRVQWTKAQAIERFGEDNIPPRLRKDDIKMNGEKWDFIHCVMPRKQYGGVGAKGMPYESKWLFVGGALFGGGGGQPAAPSEPYICSEGGYTSLPYHVGRWSKISGQEYGRSCAMTALPDIRIVNQATKVNLRAGQKVVDPPILAPHDSFMSQLDQTPGAVNFYDSTSGMDKDAIRPLITGADPKLGEEMLQPKKDTINKIFYTELGNIPFKKERQTTTEIQQQQDAILRNIAPLVGRQESELLGPMIQRTYQLLKQWGKIPPHPAKLKGNKLKIVYVSRAAQAIRSGKLGAIKSFIAETIVPMIQLAPESKDRLNTDAVIWESALLSNVTMDIFRTDQEVAAIRQDRAKQQQQQQQLQAAESASQSLANVGKAAQASPDLVGAATGGQ